MERVDITAEPRAELGTRPARRLRRAGGLPAVVYGLGQPAEPVVVDAREIQRVLHRVGHNALINLRVGDRTQLTMTREVQRHPVKGDLVHVDFVRIREDVAVEASVPVHLVGEPAGAREGGVLEHVLFEVVVRAKPADIPQSLELDVSELKVGENKQVADIVPPPGVELVTEPDRVVANVLAPRVAVEVELAGLGPDEIAELEGLSQEELEALRALAEAAPAEGAPEAEAGGEAGAEAGGGEAGGEG